MLSTVQRIPCKEFFIELIPVLTILEIEKEQQSGDVA